MKRTLLLCTVLLVLMVQWSEAEKSRHSKVGKTGHQSKTPSVKVPKRKSRRVRGGMKNVHVGTSRTPKHRIRSRSRALDLHRNSVVSESTRTQKRSFGSLEEKTLSTFGPILVSKCRDGVCGAGRCRAEFALPQHTCLPFSAVNESQMLQCHYHRGSSCIDILVRVTTKMIDASAPSVRSNADRILQRKFNRTVQSSLVRARPLAGDVYEMRQRLTCGRCFPLKRRGFSDDESMFAMVDCGQGSNTTLRRGCDATCSACQESVLLSAEFASLQSQVKASLQGELFQREFAVREEKAAFQCDAPVLEIRKYKGVRCSQAKTTSEPLFIATGETTCLGFVSRTKDHGPDVLMVNGVRYSCPFPNVSDPVLESVLTLPSQLPQRLMSTSDAFETGGQACEGRARNLCEMPRSPALHQSRIGPRGRTNTRPRRSGTRRGGFNTGEEREKLLEPQFPFLDEFL